MIDRGLDLEIRDQIPAFALGAEQIKTTPDDESGPMGHAVVSFARDRANQGRVVVLMGGIGAGKSTFLRRFFRVVSPDLGNDTGPALLVYLDFLGATDDPAQIRLQVWERIAAALRKNHPGVSTRSVLEQVFAADLVTVKSLFADTPSLGERVAEELHRLTSDNRTFAERVLKWSASCSRLPIVVFDNVDQLSVTSQAEIFTISQYVANTHGCLSILVLREESYCTAQMQRQLTAYTIRSYHLSSPKFSKMIGVRIDFATNAATQETKDRTNQRLFDDDGTYSRLLPFFRMLRRSVFDENKNIVRLIEAVSFGNMRFALDLFNSFIQSGATNIVKITDKIGPGYTVPFHEFAKSVILGDYRYYKEGRSQFLNLFQPTQFRNTSHFTSLRILQFLRRQSEVSKSGDGFCPLQALVNDLVDRFDNEEDVLQQLRRLIQLNRQLVELDTRRTEDLGGASTARLTAAGRYYLMYLSKAFAYLDLVWNDTPLPDRALAEGLARLISSTDMFDRFVRVERFLQCLIAEEVQDFARAGLDYAKDVGFWGPFMPEIKEQYLRERDLISRKLRIAMVVKGTWMGRPESAEVAASR